MKCLFVKAPFAGWIVDGVKLIEYRTKSTNIRGRIGIIESGTATMIGDVELINSVYNSTLNMYTWLLSRPRRYAKPIAFEHKHGWVTWAILDIDPDVQEIAPRLPDRVFHAQCGAYRRKIDNWLLEHTQHMANGRTE